MAGTALEGKVSHEVLGAARDGDKAPEHPFSSSALALGVIDPLTTLSPTCALTHADTAWLWLHLVRQPPASWDLLGTAQGNELGYYQHAEGQP